MCHQEGLTPAATMNFPNNFIAPCTQKLKAFSCTARSVCKLRGTSVLHPYSPRHKTASPVSLGVCKHPKIPQSHKGQEIWYAHTRVSGLAQTHLRPTNSTKAISVTPRSKTQQILQQGTVTGTSAPRLIPTPKGKIKPLLQNQLQAQDLKEFHWGKVIFPLAVSFLMGLSVISFSVKAKRWAFKQVDFQTVDPILCS